MINYGIIQSSIDFYEDKGFKRIETPWTITKEISKITAPPNATFFSITEKNKVLVASAEQSFLYLYNKGFLPKGQFQSVTPCFRDESFDELHTKYFIKNELIKTDVVSKQELDKTINIAFEFFETIFGKNTGLTVIQTQYGQYDIIYCGLELGSYGIRGCSFLKWIYGTGVAEPRLSRVMERYGISY